MPERLPPTVGQTVGPFFHQALPYAGGPDLVPATRTDAVRLHGTVYDGSGTPVPDALLEIRQADGAGVVPLVEGSLRRDGTSFTGWGRAATDSAGRYSFTTLEPGGTARFFSVAVFARGLMNRLFTRAYLPGTADAFLDSVDPARRATLQSVREDDGSLRFDVRLQGDGETVFLRFPGHVES